jgi:hypothetical protein
MQSVGVMSNEPQGRVPKIGEQVNDCQHEGAFEVVFVNALMQTANIRLIDGTAHVVPNVPWTSLTLSTKK